MYDAVSKTNPIRLKEYKLVQPEL